MLRLERVSRAFEGPQGRVKALAVVNLAVAPGEMVAVRGPSGCGKTTLLLSAGALLRPDEGRVLLGGQDVYAMSAAARGLLRAERIGFVFQQFHLIPYLTVEENVLAPSVALANPPRDVGAHAADLIRRFNLEHRSRHVPAQLSVGEKQRVALARSLLNRPCLLLADEPTGNLDEANANAILEYMLEFKRGGGAVLIVTHDARVAARADRTLLMSDGQLE
jgi:putative ABC transport system ATP-binding protein